MTTRLILIRHGDSHHKTDGVIGGPHGCRGLTAVGRQQAELLAQRLDHELGHHASTTYCSVIPRAKETANILTAALNHSNVVEDCGLCTWHAPPHADGKPWSEYRDAHRVPGGGVFRPFEDGNESWSELVNRVGRTLEQIAARHKEETVMLVTHREPIVASFIVFGGLPLAPGFDMDVAPASITEWATDGNPAAWPRPRWTLARFNDSAHLLATQTR